MAVCLQINLNRRRMMKLFHLCWIVWLLLAFQTITQHVLVFFGMLYFTVITSV